MFKFDPIIWKSVNRGYSTYCGHDPVCLGGEQTVVSLVLWVAIALFFYAIGLYAGQK